MITWNTALNIKLLQRPRSRGQKFRHHRFHLFCQRHAQLRCGVYPVQSNLTLVSKYLVERTDRKIANFKLSSIAFYGLPSKRYLDAMFRLLCTGYSWFIIAPIVALIAEANALGIYHTFKIYLNPLPNTGHSRRSSSRALTHRCLKFVECWLPDTYELVTSITTLWLIYIYIYIYIPRFR